MSFKFSTTGKLRKKNEHGFPETGGFYSHAVLSPNCPFAWDFPHNPILIHLVSPCRWNWTNAYSPNCPKLISWGNDCSGNQNLLCWIPERNCVRFYFSVQSIRPGNYCNDKSLERSIDFQCIGHFLGNSRLQRRSLWFECWLITSFVLAECLAIKQRVNDFVFNNNLPMPCSTGKSYKMSILNQWVGLHCKVGRQEL